MSEWPYTNNHELNLDWILQVVKTFQDNYTGINAALDEAIAKIIEQGTITRDAIIALREAVLSAIQEAQTQAVTAVSGAGTTAVANIDSHAETALTNLETAKTIAVNDLQHIVSQIPATYAEALGQLYTINAILNGTESETMTWNQGIYQFEETDQEYQIESSPLYVTSTMAAGCSGRTLRIISNNLDQKIRAVVWWDANFLLMHTDTISGNVNSCYYTFDQTAAWYSILLYGGVVEGAPVEISVANTNVDIYWLDSFSNLKNWATEYQNIDFTQAEYKNLRIGVNNTWQTPNAETYFIPIDPFSHTVTITTNSDNTSNLAFLLNNTPILNTPVDYAQGSTRTALLSGGITVTFTIPPDAKYIAIQKYYNGADTTPQNLIIEKFYNITYISDSFTRMQQFNIDFMSRATLLQNINGVQKFPGNIVKIEECLNNTYISTSTGSALPENPGYFCTGFMPVQAGETYIANYGRNGAWYASDKTFISSFSGTGIQNGIEAPENAAYLRFSVNKSEEISDPLNLYCADIDSYDLRVNIPNLTGNIPWCWRKTINWIGDSIVDGADFDEKVCAALTLTKLTVDGEEATQENPATGGIDGSTIALAADGTNTRHALCARYADMPENADIIAVSAGTNDFEYAWCPIGSIDDPDDGTSDNTFYGALKHLCKGLIDRYPDKLIFFTTPIKRAQPFEDGNGGSYTNDGVMLTPFNKNKYGKTLGDYADIIIEVCGYYSIPVLDMYRLSLLNPHLASQQYLFDDTYTHPTPAGQTIMAKTVAGWMAQLRYNV